jgi:RimJ/RimL family protein N-acetyltransferase
MNPRHIETERLLIRPFRPSDLLEAAAVLDSCFEPEPIERRAEWLSWTIQNYEALARLGQPPYGDVAVTGKSDGIVLGTVGLVPCLGPFESLEYYRQNSSAPASGFTAEVGLFWAVAPQHRGTGIASEAAAGLAEWAFRTLSLDRLVAMTERENAPSIGVMRRLGMVIEINSSPEPPWFQVIGVLPNPKRTPRA